MQDLLQHKLRGLTHELGKMQAFIIQNDIKSVRQKKKDGSTCSGASLLFNKFNWNIILRQ